MEIEIDSKRNNPLLNRTEIYFTIKHEGEGTPNRELIRSELADKLNVKKENIIVNTIDTSFGKQEISGYAKIYSSIAIAKETEHDHFLKRNKLVEEEKKPGKKGEKAPAAESPRGEAPAPSKDEKTVELEPKEEEKPEEPVKKEEPQEQEMPSEDSIEKKEENAEEEVKEEEQKEKQKEEETGEKEQAEEKKE